MRKLVIRSILQLNILKYICIGLVLASIISRIPLSFYNNYSKIFLFLSFLLSLVIFIPGFGPEVNGALRWLDLRFITIQVAELSRLFILNFGFVVISHVMM
ncbi:MAG: hypothetical protein Ct9H90mP3_7570 [Flammeovirgaceae bacterium]|nr:MAG: hypothetical protein Ct9H90mP3_7570 [Flammeovirgaceae bacterium]